MNFFSIYFISSPFPVHPLEQGVISEPATMHILITGNCTLATRSIKSNQIDSTRLDPTRLDLTQIKSQV